MRPVLCPCTENVTLFTQRFQVYKVEIHRVLLCLWTHISPQVFFLQRIPGTHRHKKGGRDSEARYQPSSRGETQSLPIYPSVQRGPGASANLRDRRSPEGPARHQLTDQAARSQAQLEGLCFTRSGSLCRDVAWCWEGSLGGDGGGSSSVTG